MRLLSAFVTLLAAQGLLPAQQPDRFAATAPRMQEFVDKGEAAGIVTLVATKDRILYLDAVGKSGGRWTWDRW